MNPLPLVGYFAAGAMREAVVVLYYRAVGRKKDYAASGLAGGLELFDIVILSLIIGSGWSPGLIAAYVMGVMLGTFLGTRWCK